MQYDRKMLAFTNLSRCHPSNKKLIWYEMVSDHDDKFEIIYLIRIYYSHNFNIMGFLEENLGKMQLSGYYDKTKRNYVGIHRNTSWLFTFCINTINDKVVFSNENPIVLSLSRSDVRNVYLLKDNPFFKILNEEYFFNKNNVADTNDTSNREIKRAENKIKTLQKNVDTMNQELLELRIQKYNVIKEIKEIKEEINNLKNLIKMIKNKKNDFIDYEILDKENIDNEDYDLKTIYV